MDFKQLKKGDVLSESQFYTVQLIKGDKVQIRNDHGTDVVVDKSYVEKCLLSANQFTKQVSLNKTEAAAKFLQSSGVAITVDFNTQVKEADVVAEIMAAHEGSTPKNFEAAVKKAIKTDLS